MSQEQHINKQGLPKLDETLSNLESGSHAGGDAAHAAMLAEAMEGLKTMPSSDAIRSSVLDINHRINQRAGIKESGNTIQINWPVVLGIAALLAVAIGGFVFIPPMLQQSEQLAQEKTTTDNNPASTQNNTPASSFGADSAISSEDAERDAGATTEAMLADEAPTPSDDVITEENELEEQVAESAPQELSEEETTRPSNTLNPTLLRSNEEIQNAPAAQRENESLAQDNFAEEDAIAKRRAAAERPIAEVRVTGATMEVAMQLYKEAKYVESFQQFNTVFKNNPSNDRAGYYAGFSLMNSSKCNQSQDFFDALIKKGAGRYYNSSKYCKALCLLENGQRRQAKRLLQDVAASSSSFASKAQEKLDNNY